MIEVLEDLNDDFVKKLKSDSQIFATKLEVKVFGKPTSNELRNLSF